MSPITKITDFFVKRSRFTVLLAVALIAIGFYSYTSVLKREGFPVINIPVVVVTTPYFGGTPDKTEKDITGPIYGELKQLEGVKTITTSSSQYLSLIIISLEDKGITSAEAENNIKEKISALSLPAETGVYVPNAGFIDGQNDLVFSLYSPSLTVNELEVLALKVAAELAINPAVATATPQLHYNSAFDPSTGKETTQQTAFSSIVTREDGKLKTYDAINIGVTKRDTELGALEFSTEIQDAVNKVLDESEYSEAKVIYGGDPAISLSNQISSLENNAVAAIITIFIILLLFINWRSAVILALFIPLTLGATFLTFALFGYTLNTISLFALILVLGLFVDDGTIVVEAIDYYKRQGLKGVEAVKKAINDIGVADISGTLTTVLVFAPLLAVTGILGDFIKILPLTVIIALLLSLAIALTILPLLSNWLIVDKKDGKESLIEKISQFIPKIIISFAAQVGKFTKFTLTNLYTKLAIIVIVVVAFVLGGVYASKIGFAFFAPAKDSEYMTVDVQFAPTQSFNEVLESNRQIEAYLSDTYKDEIEQIVYFGGDSRNATLYITLTPIFDREVSAIEIADEINADPNRVDGATFTAAIISAGPPMSQYPFATQIFAQSTDELTIATSEVTEFINDSKLTDNKISDVKTQYLDIVREKDGRRYAEVLVKFEDNASSSSLIDLQDLLESSDLTKDKYDLEFDFGQESENANSFNSIALSAVIAVVAMYALLVFQFNSFTQPLLVLIAVPFSFPGLFMGLYYTQNPMSFFVILGITGLVGIVVNNTIMLLEYANTRRRAGKGSIESIVEAITLRTRPILTTSLITIAGLLPLALTEPFWEPLAFTIIFGLLSSLVMIFIAFPLVYSTVEDAREFVFKKLGKKLY